MARERSRGGERSAAEIPEPQIEGLLKKLAWALRQERVDRPGSIPFFRVDRRFIEAARELVEEVAETHGEAYRRFMKPD